MRRWWLLLVATHVLCLSVGAVVSSLVHDPNSPERVEECIFGLLFITDPEARENISTGELAAICEFPTEDMDEIRDQMEEASER